MFAPRECNGPLNAQIQVKDNNNVKRREGTRLFKSVDEEYEYSKEVIQQVVN